MWEAGKKSFWRHQSGFLPLAPTQEMPDKIEHVQPPQDDIWPREPSQEGCPTGTAQSRLAITVTPEKGGLHLERNRYREAP
ncbi:MAG: hypothetical protein DMG70_17975 [Acidobacteria bacterium]|nr:MAG: hypothetical protein DMG70_17975 [Acidobacteriota bacterium]